ncbi:MAG: zinc-ribbon domain-containing protein [Eubacteriales bacterium]
MSEIDDKSYMINEWNYERNKPLLPSDLAPRSNRKVWWKCKKGHEWQATLNDRYRGTGCPYCAGNRLIEGINDLQTVNPELSLEWNYEQNNPLRPSDFTGKSRKKVWWKCKNGHEWQANISDRARGNGCPYCAGKRPIIGVNDLETVNPKLALEWNYEKNKPKVPSDYMPRSGKKVWWKCKQGHEWQATIDSRNKNGCPYCAGQRVIQGENDLVTVAPEFAKEWNYERNKNLLPTEICAKSGKKVWWKCKWNHEWQATPNSRVYHNLGCPKCSSELSTSFPEQAILYYIKQCFNDVDSRKKLENKMELDIYIKAINVGIEYDGIRYHSNKAALEREERKNLYCNKYGIILYHVVEVHEIPEIVKNNYLYRILKKREKGLDIVIEELLRILMVNSTNDIPIIDTKLEQVTIMNQYVNEKEMNEIFSDVLLKEWDYEKNGNLKPNMFSKGSNKKVWWKCSKGHSYQCAIHHKTGENVTGCPYCSNQKVLEGYNDLATIYPELVAQWNYKKNVLLPKDYTSKSYKKVWWICAHGHEWEAGINKRVRGDNCPYCGGKKVAIGYNDLATTDPVIASEWNYKLNGELTPEKVTRGSNKKVWWVCNEGHEWIQAVNQRTRRGGNICPICRGIK